jgi:SAM-dependent methyltransferase
MERLYDDLVSLYPLVSDRAAYAGEAAMVKKAVRLKLGPPGPGRRRRTLLELGVGAGHLLSHLTDTFDAVAVDLVPEMLKLSQSLNPDVEHHVGDMRTFRLKGTFDVAMIHDAIHYMTTQDDLLAAMATCHAHLKRGGVALFMPGYVKETFINGDVSHLVNFAAEGDLGYVAQTHDADPADDVYQLIFMLLRRDGARVVAEEDRHTCGVFPLATWMRLLDEAGFDARRPKLELGAKGKPAPPQTPLFVAMKR